MAKKDIKTLGDNFKSSAALEMQVLELKKENKALNETVDKLLTEVHRLLGADKLVKLELSPEQQISEMQIMRLHAASMERDLTLDETRKLDLHIKNKRLLEDKSTLNADYTALPAGMSDDELMRIAGSVEDKKEEVPKKRRRKPKTSS